MTDLWNLLARDALGMWLLSVLVQSSAVIGVALFLARLLRRNPAARYAVLRTGMLCTLASPILSLLLHSAGITLFSIPIPAAVDADTVDVAMRPLVVNEVSPAENALALKARTGAPPSPVELSIPRPASNAEQPHAAVVPRESRSAPLDTANPSHLVRPWFLSAMLVWAAGCAWRLGSLARSWFKLQHVVRRASPIADTRVRRMIRDSRSELGCRRRVTVLSSSDVNCPIAALWRRPVILLPHGICSQIDEADLRAILVHELAHVARNDHAALLIEAAFAAVYWPHPLVPFLRRGLSRAREEVCDNYVVRRMDRWAYSELLLRLARTWPPRPLVAAGVGLFSTRWRLESRVAALLDERRRTMVRTNRLTNLSIAVAMLAIVLGIGVTQVVAEREATQDDVHANQSSVADDRAKSSGDVDAVAAYVNDEPITREELAAELLGSFGKDAVETLVNRKLLEQECEKQGITITEADIVAEVDRTATKFGLNRDAWYSALKQNQGITRDRYHADVVWPTLAILRLAGKDEPDAANEYFLELKSRANIAVLAENNVEEQDDRSSTSRSGINAPTAGRLARGGQRIALVNLQRIFKEFPQFQENVEALRRDVEASEARIRELRNAIESLDLARNASNQAAKPLIDELIIERKSDLTASSEKAQKSVMDREAEVYQEAYALIQEEISDYANEHDIDIVLRDTSERPSKRAIDEDGEAGRASHVRRRDIIKQINQDIVFIRDARIDITDAIIERLRERAEEEKTRR